MRQQRAYLACAYLMFVMFCTKKNLNYAQSATQLPTQLRLPTATPLAQLSYQPAQLPPAAQLPALTEPTCGLKKMCRVPALPLHDISPSYTTFRMFHASRPLRLADTPQLPLWHPCVLQPLQSSTRLRTHLWQVDSKQRHRHTRAPAARPVGHTPASPTAKGRRARLNPDGEMSHPPISPSSQPKLAPGAPHNSARTHATSTGV